MKTGDGASEDARACSVLPLGRAPNTTSRQTENHQNPNVKPMKILATGTPLAPAAKPNIYRQRKA